MVQEAIAPAPTPVAPAVSAAVVEAPPAPAPVVPADGSPAPTPAVLPTAPVAEAPASTPTVSPETQAYIAELEARAVQAEETQNAQLLQQFVQQHAKQLEEQQGLTPEQAQYIAKQEGERARKAYQAERFRTMQINAAITIAQEYKIDPRTIMNLPTPAAMHEAAKAATQQNAERTRIAQLEAEVARLKMAPAQTFASPAAAAQPGSSNYIDALRGKGPLPSAAEIDKFTAQYMSRQG